MREKIYHCLSLLNIILFTIVSSIFLHSVIDLHFEIESPIYLSVFIASILWLVVLYFAVKNIKNQKNELANLDFNIIIFLLTPIVFFFQQWLSILILLNYLLLPVFLPYEKLNNRQLNWNFWILFSMFLTIFILTIDIPFKINDSWNYWNLIILFILFISFIIKKKYWIILSHLVLSLFFIYQNSWFFFIVPFRASPTTFNFLLLAIGILYMKFCLHFIFTTFSLVYFNNKSRKNSLKMKTWTE